MKDRKPNIYTTDTCPKTRPTNNPPISQVCPQFGFLCQKKVMQICCDLDMWRPAHPFVPIILFVLETIKLLVVVELLRLELL